MPGLLNKILSIGNVKSNSACEIKEIKRSEKKIKIMTNQLNRMIQAKGESKLLNINNASDAWTPVEIFDSEIPIFGQIPIISKTLPVKIFIKTPGFDKIPDDLVI